jgi:hypothetical protein
MRLKVFCLVSVLIGLFVVTAAAQEGHPVIGTWSGEWGPSASQRSPVLVVMEYKTGNITGVLNPGYPDEAPLSVATLNSRNWTMHIEADSKDERGNPAKVVIDGKMENIGSHNRTLTGTWTRGNVKGEFKLTRE